MAETPMLEWRRYQSPPETVLLITDDVELFKLKSTNVETADRLSEERLMRYKKKKNEGGTKGFLMNAIIN